MTNMASFARFAKAIANCVPDQQLITLYLLTKTILAVLPLEDVQGGASGGLLHKRCRPVAQQERLKLLARGKWKDLYDLCMA
jgi:hypothetical protein